MFRRSFFGLLLLGAAACARAQQPAPRPPIAAKNPDAREASAVGAVRRPAGRDAASQHRLDAALAKVVRLRGLPARRAVELRSMSRAEVRTYVRARIRRDLPPHVLSGMNDVLTALAQVPPAFDFAAALEEMFVGALVGLYDPDEKLMFLRDNLPPLVAETTLYHELVHALQDQHYDLAARVSWRADDNDRVAALHALAEGDATSAMLSLTSTGDDVAARAARGADAEREANAGHAGDASERTLAPNVVERLILAAYDDGLDFVEHLRERGGWPAVNAAWQQPPTTTEQLLHPEKYAAREPAEPVAIPTLPGASAAYHDVIGEQAIRVFLEQWLSPSDAALAAADWGGDRLAVLEKAGSQMVVWHLRYDTVAATERLAHALALGAVAGPGVKAPLSGGTPRIRNGAFCALRLDRGPYAIVTQQRDVTFVAGPAQDGNSQPEASCAAALASARIVIKTANRRE